MSNSITLLDLIKYKLEKTRQDINNVNESISPYKKIVNNTITQPKAQKGIESTTNTNSNFASSPERLQSPSHSHSHDLLVVGELFKTISTIANIGSMTVNQMQNEKY